MSDVFGIGFVEEYIDIVIFDDYVFFGMIVYCNGYVGYEVVKDFVVCFEVVV